MPGLFSQRWLWLPKAWKATVTACIAVANPDLSCSRQWHSFKKACGNAGFETRVAVAVPDLLAARQVFGWYSGGAVEMNDVTCSLNEAEENGGCFYSAGIGIVNNGTVMLDNLADSGGCICGCQKECSFWESALRVSPPGSKRKDRSF